MENVLGEGIEVDTAPDIGLPINFDDRGDGSRVASGENGPVLSPGPDQTDYLAKTKETYKPLGIPDEIIKKIAAVETARAMLLSLRCDTAEREAFCKHLLSHTTGEVLGTLMEQVLTSINATTLIARAVRRLAPDEFDAWVDLQMSNGVCLGMITAVRDFRDVSGEGQIEDNLAEGRLAAASVMPVLSRLTNFVGILRPKLESDLRVRTAADHMELDSAIDSYLIARRLQSTAQSLIAPIPRVKDLAKGLKLLEQAKAYDKAFHASIDRIRTRTQRRDRRIQVGNQTNVAIQVNANMTEESPRVEAVSA